MEGLFFGVLLLAIVIVVGVYLKGRAAETRDRLKHQCTGQPEGYRDANTKGRGMKILGWILISVAVVVHFSCCEWDLDQWGSSDATRQIFGPFLARNAFGYTSGSGFNTVRGCNTVLAGFLGLALPTVVAGAGIACLLVSPSSPAILEHLRSYLGPWGPSGYQEPDTKPSTEKPSTARPGDVESDRPNPRLLPCPDCGRLVSRLATSCPQCGRPLDSQN